MNLVLKTSLKNIFGKPFRTLLVVFSIFVCAICAMVCFDFVSSVRELLGGASLGLSKSDFLLVAHDYSAKGLPDGFPECELLEINTNDETFYKDIEGEYNYVTTETLGIYGVNVADAINMEFIEPMTLGLNETVVTAQFAKEYGYDLGDTLIVHDRQGNRVELKITGISTESKNFFISKYTAFVNEETSEIISCGKKDVGIIIGDVKDNELSSAAIRMLKDYYPNAIVMDLSVSDQMQNILDQLVLYFYLIFAIAFLLVIFVTTSICNRIVSERMPFIGTLRSLGMSNARTGRILLLENTLYAVLGSIPAIIVYGFVRIPILKTFTAGSTRSSYTATIPPMSVFVIAGVILGAVIIECLIPLKAILKALKTSIRDIIFDNRDTAYRFSKPGLVIGLIFASGALISLIFSRNIAGAIFCLVFSVTSLALLFPWIFKGVTSLIRKIADKKEYSKWSLAAVEAVSRKSTVGSGVLCVTAAAMSIVVFSFVQSTFGSVSNITFSSDVVLTCTKNMKSYMFVDDLEGVTEIETVYVNSSAIRLNDEAGDDFAVSGTFYALPEDGYKYYTIFEELPGTMEDGTIVVEEKYAESKGIDPGDTIKITYNPTSVLPIVREYKVASFYRVDPKYRPSEGSFFLSERDYKEIFKDTPGYLLIMCENPDYVARMIRTYAIGAYSDVKTLDEMYQAEAESNAKLKVIASGIIIIAVGMTFIGMVSNQLIGFEGRKKECAVMLSTAMDKGKLSGILFREMFITAVTASSLGTVVGILMVAVINLATSSSEIMEMDVNASPVMTLLFGVFLVIAFTGTVLFPIKSLGKMKIAEQIKYE